MKKRFLIGTDLLLSYLLNTEYAEGISVLFHWIQRINAVKMIDKGSIRILMNFVKINELSRLRDFDAIPVVPKMNDSLRLMINNAVTQNLDNRALLMQLNLLEQNYTDYLITENRWTHDLARFRTTDDRVFTIDEFLEMCVMEYRNLDVIRGIILTKIPLGILSLNDRFFNTFKEEYAPYYYTWFKKKRNDPVYVAKDKDDALFALLKLKIEDEIEIDNDIIPRLPSARRLKISSLKVEYTGQKIGERFMRIIFDQALHKHVNYIYVTVFANSSQRKRLISMIEKWGFSFWGYKAGKEEVYIRLMQKQTTTNPAQYYPYQSRQNNAYLIPVAETFANLLVPPIEKRKNVTDYEPFRNAIRKMLVIDGNKRTSISIGNTLLFFRKEACGGYVIASGVVDGVWAMFTKEDDFLRRCKKRSLLSIDALHDYWVRYKGHLIVIDFLHTYSFRYPEIGPEKLIDAGIDINRLTNMYPQQLNQKMFDQLIKNTQYEKDIIVD